MLVMYCMLLPEFELGSITLKETWNDLFDRQSRSNVLHF